LYCLFRYARDPFLIALLILTILSVPGFILDRIYLKRNAIDMPSTTEIATIGSQGSMLSPLFYGGEGK
jgi:hypothetical protein